MCTVSFLPGLPCGGYVLATNRDESPRRRPALPPFATELGGRLVLAPRDGDAGGTWVGVDERGLALTVLNGDGPAAAPAPADPVSRGLLVLELLERRTPREVLDELQRRAAAGALRFKPFKLLAVAPGEGVAPARLWRGDWDGARLQVSEHDGPQCVTSSGVQPAEVQHRRGAEFARLVERVRPSLRANASEEEVDALVAAVHALHASHEAGAPGGDAYSVCMHRAEARTVSSTVIVAGCEAVEMNYLAGWPCQDGELQVMELARA